MWVRVFLVLVLKLRGMPGEVKTTIDPLKTLTPRFITKALEKTKKTK